MLIIKKPGKHRYIACQMNELDPYVPTNINFKAIMFNENKKMPSIYFYVIQKLLKIHWLILHIRGRPTMPHEPNLGCHCLHKCMFIGIQLPPLIYILFMERVE